jgi:hypothetical protein
MLSSVKIAVNGSIVKMQNCRIRRDASRKLKRGEEKQSRRLKAYEVEYGRSAETA